MTDTDVQDTLLGFVMKKIRILTVFQLLICRREMLRSMLERDRTWPVSSLCKW